MPSHFLFAANLAYGVGSRVWWSHNPGGNVLVFVHGFKGQALGTWAGFPSALTQQSEYSDWDLIFFGYDGAHTEAVSSAAELSQLLDMISHSPTQLYNKSTSSPYSTRQHPPAYKRVVLVSHSLGAVVSRRAMLDGYNRKIPASWAATTELYTFAPAHNGAKLMALVLETIGPAAVLVPFVQLLGKYIVLRDLKEHSDTLNTLHDDLKRTFDGGAGNLRAIGTVWVKNDAIVNNKVLYPDFSVDAVLSGRTHTSVCKPSASFPEPAKLLTAGLGI